MQHYAWSTTCSGLVPASRFTSPFRGDFGIGPATHDLFPDLDVAWNEGFALGVELKPGCEKGKAGIGAKDQESGGARMRVRSASK